MIETKSLIDALEEDMKTEKNQNTNDDHDFGLVLEFCSEGELKKHALPYSDGNTKTFSFE